MFLKINHIRIEMGIYSELVESLEKCSAACKNCAISSLQDVDRKPMSTCIKLNLHCAELCHLALSLLERDSDQASSAVKLCMAMCDECATECENYEYDQCRLSAEACRITEKNGTVYLEQAAETVSI